MGEKSIWENPFEDEVTLDVEFDKPGFISYS